MAQHAYWPRESFLLELERRSGLQVAPKAGSPFWNRADLKMGFDWVVDEG